MDFNKEECDDFVMFFFGFFFILESSISLRDFLISFCVIDIDEGGSFESVDVIICV